MLAGDQEQARSPEKNNAFSESWSAAGIRHEAEAHVKKVRGEIYDDQLLAPARVLFLIDGGVSPSNLFRKNNARHVGGWDIGRNGV